MIFLLIHRMTATFGKLQNAALELREGLNIVEAPNESGKSTWCAFLLTMLYGFNSRERDRQGFVAEKNRFAPWSGAAMTGRLDCRVGAEELTLLRETRRQTAPMGEFSAVYAGTGDAVPNLTGQTCGERLVGVSREVYERSAMIRQAGLPIGQSAELERQITALITTGEEDTSYSETVNTLKKQLNGRRHIKTGLLPEAERELEETEGRLVRIRSLEQELTDARGEFEKLADREAALRDQLAAHDRYDAALRRRALDGAASAAQDAEARLGTLRAQAAEARLPEAEAIARLRGAIVNLETTRKAVGKSMAEKDAAMRASVRVETALSDTPFAGMTAEEAKREAETPPTVRTALTPAVVLTALLAASCILLSALLFVFLADLPGGVRLGTAGAALAAGAVGGIFCRRSRIRAVSAAKAAALAKRFGTADPAEIAALAEAYAKLCESRDAAQKAVTETAATYNALYAALSSNEQGILLEVRRFAPAAFDIPAADAALQECAASRKTLSAADAAVQKARMEYELLAGRDAGSGESGPGAEFPQPPGQSREALSAQLAEVLGRLAAARSAADRLCGQLAAAGDPAALRSEAGALRERITALEGEYGAIQLAMSALDSANAILQSRFSPELGRRAAEIFSEMTDGRYRGVVLDRAFRLSAEPAESPVYREAGLLSAGAADQLYLATRLAVCGLVLPGGDPAPLVLDDVLASFDDRRAQAALHFLKEEARTRQVLLFTCHTREAAWLREDRDVHIQQLTTAGPAV